MNFHSHSWPHEEGFYFGRLSANRQTTVFQLYKDSADEWHVAFLGTDRVLRVFDHKFRSLIVFAIGPIKIPERFTR